MNEISQLAGVLTVLVVDDPPDWQPLLRLARRCDGSPVLPAMSPEDFAYVAKVVTPDGLAIHVYEHLASRQYLNLDDIGRAWHYLPDEGVPPAEPLCGGRHALLPRATLTAEACRLRRIVDARSGEEP